MRPRASILGDDRGNVPCEHLDEDNTSGGVVRTVGWDDGEAVGSGVET